MANITAKDVASLRERTGVGIICFFLQEVITILLWGIRQIISAILCLFKEYRVMVCVVVNVILVDSLSCG